MSNQGGCTCIAILGAGAGADRVWWFEGFDREPRKEPTPNLPC